MKSGAAFWADKDDAGSAADQGQWLHQAARHRRGDAMNKTETHSKGIG